MTALPLSAQPTRTMPGTPCNPVEASARQDTDRACVLFIGPDAPAVGGMVSVLRQMTQGPLADAFDLKVHVANAQLTDRPSLLKSIRHHLGRLWTLRRTLSSQAVDVVHIHTCSGFTFYRNLADAALARLFGSAVLLHVHGGRFEQFYAQANPLGRWIIRRGLTRADRVLVSSKSWRQRLSRLAPQAQFFEVPNAVPVDDVPDTTPAPNPRRKCRFIFLGLMSPSKGVDLLLQASAELIQRSVPFHLTLVGPTESGSGTLDVPAQIDRRALGGHVDYLGMVSEQAKSDLLGRSDCLVLPSLAEAMPISILEAGAVGLAVIASDVGDVRQVLGQDSQEYVLPAGDLKALIDAMTRLATQPHLPPALGTQLRQRILDNYSVTHQTRLLTDLYRRLGRSKYRCRAEAPIRAGGAQP